MTKPCNPIIIKLRQGDDSDFNGNKIIFRIRTNFSLIGWKAKFQLQQQTWNIDNIEDNKIELIITAEQTDSLDVGMCYGWLQLIDENNKVGTIFAQRFNILKKEVF